jgi:hypothetical protein
MNPTTSLTAETITASQNPTHPNHHFSLGQVLATIILGAEVAGVAVTQPAALLTGSNLTAFIQGFLQIWIPKPTTN